MLQDLELDRGLRLGLEGLAFKQATEVQEQVVPAAMEDPVGLVVMEDPVDRVAMADPEVLEDLADTIKSVTDSCSGG